MASNTLEKNSLPLESVAQPLQNHAIEHTVNIDDQCDIRALHDALHDGKVGCNTGEYTRAIVIGCIFSVYNQGPNPSFFIFLVKNYSISSIEIKNLIKNPLSLNCQ